MHQEQIKRNQRAKERSTENVRGGVDRKRLQWTSGRPSFGAGNTSWRRFPESGNVILAAPCIVGDPLAELDREAVWQTTLQYVVWCLHIRASCNERLVWNGIREGLWRIRVVGSPLRPGQTDKSVDQRLQA